MMTMIRAKTPLHAYPRGPSQDRPPGRPERRFQAVPAEQFDGQHAGEPAEEPPGDGAESQQKRRHENGPDQSRR